MSDEIKKVREAIEKCREHGKEGSGTICMFSETGPVSIDVVEKIAAALDSLDERISKLEQGSLRIT